MKKEVISTKKAPQAVGPYSQGIKFGNMIFTSGQIPFIPESGELISEDIQEQTRQAFKNVKAVLEKAGATMNDIIKVSVFLNDIEDFSKVNEVYAEFFIDNYPARSCVEVSRLPKNVGIEIEAIAMISK